MLRAVGVVRSVSYNQKEHWYVIFPQKDIYS